MCLFVQRQIFACATGNLHEADLGIKAYAVEVFISLDVSFVLEHIQVDILNPQKHSWFQ